MLTDLVSTAGKYLSMLLLAVFFSSPATAGPDSSLYNLEQGFTDLVFRLSRSVVTVESWQRVPGSQLALTEDEVVQHQISSGIICDTLGHILVAAPMVVGHDQVMVTFDRGLMPAALVGVDYWTNLAVLSIDKRVGVPVNYSDRRMCAGQMVMAVGSAYGLRASPSIGFCAGLRPDGNIQFTVPVTSGYIGGGVFDLSGKLLGIVTGGVGADNQISQAVPAYRLPDIVAYILENGDRLAGYLGVTSAEIEISPGIEVAQQAASTEQSEIQAPRVIDRGVIITKVLPRSPAERSGLKVGDLIFSYDGHLVTSARELAREVICTRPGTAVDMELIRQNTYYDLQLRIGKKELPTYDSELGDEVMADDRRVADSLSKVLEGLKKQIEVIENRLSSLKR